MTPLLLAVLAGTGVYLLYTAVVMNRRSILAVNTTRAWSGRTARWQDVLAQVGFAGTPPSHVAGALVGVCAVGALIGWMLFGGLVAPVLASTFGAYLTFTWLRGRHQGRQAQAAEAWPRMIEEIRLLCGSLGRPIPQALLEVGKQGPESLRPAFVTAEREWLISTDFARTVTVLKERLADPTADAACETLLVAHNLGGSDVHQRLAALAEDRRLDLIGRKTARAKQAGVRFARSFVLIVPLGMALAGMSIGDGRSAYETPLGQLGVAFGLLTLTACWWWAGRLIRLPQEERVLRG